jgi:hypothetical protein
MGDPDHYHGQLFTLLQSMRCLLSEQVAIRGSNSTAFCMPKTGMPFIISTNDSNDLIFLSVNPGRKVENKKYTRPVYSGRVK